MQIGFKLLENVNNVNSFATTLRLELIDGNAATLFFQLIQRTASDELRYIPATGATVSVVFNNLDINKVVTRVASQPYPGDDRSIWQVPVLFTDKIEANSLEVTLTEGSVVTKLVPMSDLVVRAVDSKRYFI